MIGAQCSDLSTVILKIKQNKKLSCIYNNNSIYSKSIKEDEILKYLFNIDYIKNNSKISNNLQYIKPLSTIFKSHIGITDVIGYACGHGCCNNFSENDNETFLGYSFDIQSSNYIMNLSDIIFDDNNIIGKIDIELPSKSFNHASCQGQIIEYEYVDSYKENIAIINYEINFEITLTEIILDIIPMIVV